jgi:hypothetical protein
MENFFFGTGAEGADFFLVLFRTLFEKCVASGQVDGFVLAQLRNACSVSVFEELTIKAIGIKGSVADTKIVGILEKMPATWNRNLID